MSSASMIDRKVTQTLDPTPENTPSSIDSIDRKIELCHRLHGTSLLSSASTLLRIKASTFTTSCTIFHRFYHRCSLKDFDVWSVSMACILLAGKMEEDTRRLREIVLVFLHLYRRRRLIMIKNPNEFLEKLNMSFERKCNDNDDDDDDDDDDDRLQISSPVACKLSFEEKENLLRNIPPISTYSRHYQEWKDAMCNTEIVILKVLGYTLYWIPDSHPHKFILYFAKVMELDEQVAQRAWNYCNDSCRLDICVRFDAEVTACAAIYLASRDLQIFLPLDPRPWWEVFIGPNQIKDLSLVCNAMLAMTSNVDDDDGISLLVKKATILFIPSLKKDGSFNDPGSFLWYLLNSVDEKRFENSNQKKNSSQIGRKK